MAQLVFACDNMAVHYSLNTPFGTVKIARADEGGDYWVAVGQWTFHAEDPYVMLYRSFKMRGGVAVLLGSNPGGSATWVDHYYLLLLTPKKRPQVITDEDFYSAICAISLRVTKSTIFIDLGYEDGKKKTATFRSGRLVVEKKVLPTTALSAEACKALFDETTRNCIHEPKPSEDECLERLGYHDISEQSNLTVRSHMPGMNLMKLGETCVDECEKGEAVPFAEFERNVCRK